MPIPIGTPARICHAGFKEGELVRPNAKMPRGRKSPPRDISSMRYSRGRPADGLGARRVWIVSEMRREARMQPSRMARRGRVAVVGVQWRSRMKEVG